MMYEKIIETFGKIQARKTLNLPANLRPLFANIAPKNKSVLFIGPDIPFKNIIPLRMLGFKY